MNPDFGLESLEAAQEKYPEKFVSQEIFFRHIRRGARIFVGTACGEPQFLVNELIQYVESHPNAFYDAEVLHVWSLGVAPYTDEKFRHNFRHNSFFIGNNTRADVNCGNADYTPIFLSQVPRVFRRGTSPIDIALIQTSLPDRHGNLSLGVSVDIVKAAVEVASVVIVQLNRFMPRVHGHGFIHMDEVDFALHHDEPLLEYQAEVADDVAKGVGQNVARIIKDGDCIQVGYGSVPNAILGQLEEKQNLGVHTELLTDGIIDLMRKGAINNSCKSINA